MPKKIQHSLRNTQASNQLLSLADERLGTKQYYEDDSNDTFQVRSFQLFHLKLTQYFLRPYLEDVLRMRCKLFYGSAKI